MAWLGLDTDGTNVPVATGDGAAGLAAPTGHDVARTSGPATLELGLEFDAYAGEAAHDADELVTVERLRQIQAAAWYVEQIFQGVVGPVQYNAGAGNNVSEQLRYELVSVSGTTVRLRGQDPWDITLSYSFLNPDWPGAGESRLEYTTVEGAIPHGAELRFRYPSVLQDKLRPCITAMTYVSGSGAATVFDAEVWAAVGNAMEPVDGAIEWAGPWEVDVMFYYVACPPSYVDIQRRLARGWMRRTMTFRPGDLSGGLATLVDSAGGGARALTPAMLSQSVAADVLRVRVWEADGTFTEVADPAALLTTTQSGGGWTTTVDLSAWSGTLERAEVRWLCPMTATDDATTAPTVRFASTCRERRDWDGYGNPDAGDGDARCARASDASLVANFADGGGEDGECWQPSCSRWSAPVDTGTESGGDPTLYDAADPGLWDRAVAGIPIGWEQYLPALAATANYKMFRPEGGQGSLIAAGGAWGSIPTGKWPTRQPWGWRWVGQRVTYTDDDGGTRQQQVLGSWYAEYWTKSNVASGAEVNAFDAADPAGTLADGVWPALADLSRTAPTGCSYPPAVDEITARHVMRGGRCHLYDLDVVSGRAGASLLRVDSVQQYVLGHALDDEPDATLEALVRARCA